MLQRILGGDERLFSSVVHVLSMRYVKVRYRGSALGILWSALNPAVMTALYAAVFGHAFRNFYNGSLLGYAAAVFAGLTAIQFLSSAGGQAMASIAGSGMLISRIKLPVLAIPVSIILASCVQLVAGVLPILLVLGFVVGRNALVVPFVLFPLACLVCMTLGIGLALSAANVFFRDAPYLYDMFIFMMFVATPVFYPLDILNAHVRPFVEWNPLAMVVDELRTVIVLGQLPSWTSAVALAAISLAMLALGMIVFGKTRRAFVDYL